MTRGRILGLAVLGLLAATVALADAPADADWQKWLPQVHIYFRTFFLYQNDSDFDRTKPLYNKYGQSVGYLSTMFRPLFLWSPLPAITLGYELELGDNIWSENDARQGDATGAGRPIFRHRQFWGQLKFPSTDLSLAVGYQYVHDPTHLVLDGYYGAAHVDYAWAGGTASVGAMQIPDRVYEGTDPNQAGFDADLQGFDPNRNNFQNDDFFFYVTTTHALRGAVPEASPGMPLMDAKRHILTSPRRDGALTLSPGVFVRWDATVIHRPRWYAAPAVNLAWSPNPLFALDLDLAGQFGTFRHGGIDNHDLTIAAGAAQLSATVDADVVALRIGFLAFSGDKDRKDSVENGYDYSGFSKGPTVILTENWLQDQYNNLDEKVAAQKAGLFLVDAQVTVRPLSSLSVYAIVGNARVWENHDLNGDAVVGTEIDGGVTWEVYKNHAKLNLLAASLLPGKAAAALVNEIDTRATVPLWNVQGSMELMF